MIHSKDTHLPLPEYIRENLAFLPLTNTLAYFFITVASRKMFIVLIPDVHAIKLFTLSPTLEQKKIMCFTLIGLFITF